MKFDYPQGATPLDPDEVSELIPSYIATQAELNAAEQKNIMSAQLWLRKKFRADILSESFLKRLHQEMFKDVWRWAGKFRKTEKNLGAAPYDILSEIQKLFADTKYWIENQTYSWVELGVRFHHRLVVIHAFSNGNGRHARLMTDALLSHFGQETFTWGAKKRDDDLVTNTEVRQNYLKALRSADQKNYGPLIKFVRE